MLTSNKTQTPVHSHTDFIIVDNLKLFFGKKNKGSYGRREHTPRDLSHYFLSPTMSANGTASLMPEGELLTSTLSPPASLFSPLCISPDISPQALLRLPLCPIAFLWACLVHGSISMFSISMLKTALSSQYSSDEI